MHWDPVRLRHHQIWSVVVVVVRSGDVGSRQIIFVTTWPNQPQSQAAVLAYARSCRYAQGGRPIMGHVCAHCVFVGLRV
jgi:hypothetical protein